MARPPARNAVGRPRRSSRRVLEEAAAELFLEQGYPGTTVDQIASRAGVSRNTFFNYFGSKSDVLWVDVDAALAGLERALAAGGDTPATDVADAMPSLQAALLGIAEERSNGAVPWALTQIELMDTAWELQASGLERLLRLQAVLRVSLARLAVRADELTIRSAAAALAGAIVAGAGAWAAAGVGRGELGDYLRRAIAPVVDGYARALARIDGPSSS
ncbi:TetR family transcriptional regulator [Plantibacter sp. VKM Ac-2885]|uniref:TetR/AcrR family transcriptional regulator n=1 Tax=unclassified Plantibacter TaxID=2624265 RepID=UPI00177C394B|nr:MULTISPECIES: TetR/AcrR family transcriptional regulator [unclassified Plantibacter]MBD8102684.1 TetR family transcriptional regulator [Plantibacter sp. CFBP 8775]MBF4512760.1 TetR family transcriptional regulator [Plantibacter sp. VKM Ac-2885]